MTYNKNLIALWIFMILLIPIFVNAEIQVRSEQGYMYNDPVFHYSFKIPAGWKRIPVKEFQYFISQYKKMLPDKAAKALNNVELGFYQESNNYFEYPYILIFNFKMEYEPFDQIADEYSETDMQAATEDIKNEMEGLLKDIKLENLIIDKKRNSIIMNLLSKQKAGEAQVVTIMGIYYGNERKVQINFSTLGSLYSTHYPVFYSIYKSFSFDSGYAYDDFPGIKNRHVRKIFDSGLIPIAASVFVGFLIAYLRKKRSDRLKRKKELDDKDMGSIIKK